MALNAFIKKAPATPLAEALEKPTQRPTPNKPERANKRSAAAEIAMAQTTGVQITVAPELEIGKDGIALFSEQEAGTLRALSALQIKYGHAGEAVPYLMMLRRTNPDDLNASRLLAKALMKLGRWDQADLILAELEKSTEVGRDEEAHGLVMLYRGIAAFKTRRLADARNWLAKFRAKIAGATS